MFKESVQTCGQQIRYYGVGYLHQNAIVERRIKKLTLFSWTLLLLTTILWTEAVITVMWPFSFKAMYQRYNSLDMDEDGKTSEQNISGVEFQSCPTDCHT